jgi:hypothetical protein
MRPRHNQCPLPVYPCMKGRATTVSPATCEISTTGTGSVYSLHNRRHLHLSNNVPVQHCQQLAVVEPQHPTDYVHRSCLQLACCRQLAVQRLCCCAQWPVILSFAPSAVFLMSLAVPLAASCVDSQVSCSGTCTGHACWQQKCMHVSGACMAYSCELVCRHCTRTTCWPLPPRTQST